MPHSNEDKVPMYTMSVYAFEKKSERPKFDPFQILSFT